MGNIILMWTEDLSIVVQVGGSPVVVVVDEDESLKIVWSEEGSV